MLTKKEDTVGPLNLERGAGPFTLLASGPFKGEKVIVRRWLSYCKSYAVRLAGGGVVFAQPHELQRC